MTTHPTIFFKYTTSDTAEKILATGLLRWSDPRVFNDLTEFQRVPVFDTTLQDALVRLPTIYADAVYGGEPLDEARLTDMAMQLLNATRQLKDGGYSRDEAMDLIRSLPSRAGSDASPDEMHAKAIRAFTHENLLDGARVLCVTTDPMNAVMWDHYAGHNTGCVLGFRHLPEKSTALLAARQVKYVDDMTLLGSAIDYLLYGENQRLTSSTLEGVVYTKARDYSFEREWRAVTWRKAGIGASFGDYPFFVDELESVTFGARLPTETESALRALLKARYPAATLHRIVTESGALRRMRLD